MMNRYATRFKTLRASGKKAFISFTLLGWPTEATCQRILKAMVASKPAALELGLPFSDPVADGVVIQHAVQETLKRGFRMEEGLRLIAYARSLDADLPIGLLVYYNTVLAMGGDAFFAKIKAAGADAVLIADLPAELAAEVAPAAKAAGIELIFIVSPLTQEARLKALASVAGGFLYVVSRLGITGAEERYDAGLAALIERCRAESDLPCCVGFGISTPTQAQAMLALGADGTITGSRLIQLCRSSLEADVSQLEADIEAFLSQMLSVHATA